MKLTARSATLMVLASVLWGGQFLVAGIAIEELSPYSLTLLRWAIAAVPLLVIAQLVEKPDWRRVWRLIPRLTLLATLGMLGYVLLLYWALETTTPIGASLVNAAGPAVMALIAAWIGHERLRSRAVVGILISFAGVLLVISGGSWEALASVQFVPGQLLMLGAITVWAFYTIWGRGMPIPPITATAVQAVIAVVLLLPFAPLFGIQMPTTSTGVWAVLFIGLLPSVGSYVLWNIAVRTAPASIAGIFLNLITVSAVGIGALFGAEVTAADIIGGIVIIGGVIVTSLPAKQSARRSAPPKASID